MATQVNNGTQPQGEHKNKPRLRHEFVGMMFALAIGEVGLQAGSLIRAGNFGFFLPAYSHLFLATFMIAASWVGWSLSVAPGTRKDVRGIFQLEFVVLLIDVALVVNYFVLVRTVGATEKPLRIDPASTVAFWVFVIFCLYLFWDFVTRCVACFTAHKAKWLRNEGSRMLPTVICVVLAWLLWRTFSSTDRLHWLSADFALLCLVLLFRALKDLVSRLLPRESRDSQPSKVDDEPPPSPWVSFAWSLICGTGLILGTLATTNSWALPIPSSVAQEIGGSPPPASYVKGCCGDSAEY